MSPETKYRPRKMKMASGGSEVRVALEQRAL